MKNVMRKTNQQRTFELYSITCRESRILDKENNVERAYFRKILENLDKYGNFTAFHISMVDNIDNETVDYRISAGKVKSIGYVDVDDDRNHIHLTPFEFVDFGRPIEFQRTIEITNKKIRGIDSLNPT
jgi:predicted transcriptional regulator